MKHLRMVSKPHVSRAQAMTAVEIISMITTILSAIATIVPLFSKD